MRWGTFFLTLTLIEISAKFLPPIFLDVANLAFDVFAGL